MTGRAALLWSALVVLVGGGVMVLWPPEQPPAVAAQPAQPAAAPGADATIETTLRERLATLPCDRDASLALIETLAQHARWRDVQTFATTSVHTCGTLGRMKWYLAQADHELRDYAAEEVVTSELIAADPTVSDAWWWQGEALVFAGKHAAALAADRQALALALDAHAAQPAAERLAVPAVVLREPCETLRAYRYYGKLGGDLDQIMTVALAADARAHTCAAEAGTGTATLRGKLQVTLAAATAPMDADRALGTTLLSRAFAARAGIVPTADSRVQTTSRGKLYTGTPARVTLHVGDSSAQGVDALVTDDLPADTAGVIGLSYLWHFAIAPHEGGGLAISPLPSE